jgi:hypothetical protein
MKNHQNENFRWAQENGYDYHAETQGAISEGARGLGVFRGAESFQNHVVGAYRNRPFEILDVRKEERHHGSFGYVEKTVVLVSTAGLDLPDFELLPRRENAGLNFLGIKGLDLKLSDNAPRDERQMVDAFNKNYSLFAGGAVKSMKASITSANHLVPDLADMALICKPGVLRFLSKITTGTIEVRNGYLAVRAPETRIIRGTFADTILTGRERENLLAVANDLLDVLQNASREATLRGLTLENNYNPARMFGALIGAGVGFFIGLWIGILMMCLLGKNFILLIPVFPLGGLALGGFLGKR